MAMKLIILLFLLHQFHAVASVILKGKPISTHPFGSKVKLTCVKEKGALVWTTATGDILFIDEARYSKDEKYENFEVDISGNQSSMIITNALFEDEGEYSCSDANGKETILVKLEVAPRLIISYGGRQDPGPHIPSSSSPSISITCLAEGAKPEVSIRFKVGESDWLSPTNNEITPRGVLFDTNATLNYQFIDDPNGNVVTCETSGQSSIKPIAETQTLMTPHCNLEMNSTEATCNCTSNPPVYKYILSIDGIIEVGNTINVENLRGSNISCYGVNYIGVGTYSSIVLESTTDSSFPVYVIIIVVVLFAVAVITLVVVYRWKKKHKSQASKSFQLLAGTLNDSKDTGHSEDANQRESANNSVKKGAVSPCSVRKPTDNSNDVATEKEKLLAQSSPAESERSQIPWNKGSPAESERSQIPWNKEHNHGSFKSTDTENRNAQRDNQHGAAGTPTARENKKHNHGRYKPTDTENRNAQRDNQHGAAGTPTASKNKKQTDPVFALIGSQNQSHASPEQKAVQPAKRVSSSCKNSNEQRSKEHLNGANFKEENEKNGEKDELASLKGKHEKQKMQYQEAANKNSQHNAGQESNEELGKLSRQKIVGEVKAMFESQQLQLQPNSGLHSKAQESEDSVKTSIPEAPKRQYTSML